MPEDESVRIATAPKEADDALYGADEPAAHMN